MKALRLFAALAAIVGTASIQSPANAETVSHDPATVKAGTYTVEPAHTQIEFSISHLGFTNFSGFFSGASGTLRLDPANPAASRLDVKIPVQSVLTTSTVLDGELKGSQWFDAAHYPVATFQSTKIVVEGHGHAEILGNFTLHGVTKPITLQARFVGAGVNPMDKTYTVGFEATGIIKRSDYGITKYIPLVGDDVHLTIAGAFEHKP